MKREARPPASSTKGLKNRELRQKPIGASLRLADHFKHLPDFWVERTKRHLLLDMVVMTIGAVICGAEEWKAVSLYGHKKKRWLKTFLELPKGIPSYYTFRRVFLYWDAEKLQARFLHWVAALSQVSRGQIMAIDGKCLRGSVDQAGQRAAIDRVSAFASANRTQLHWTLDVSFHEDACRVRKGHAPQNLAVIRHMALKLLKKETTAGVGIKTQRQAASWDNDYLLQVLVGSDS